VVSGNWADRVPRRIGRSDAVRGRIGHASLRRANRLVAQVEVENSVLGARDVLGRQAVRR